MNMVDSGEALARFIRDNEMVLIYFGTQKCSVCNVMEPKVEELLKNYLRIKSAKIDVEKSLQISAEYSIFTIPVILLFIEGKEVIREARYISLQDVNNKIERYYDFFFNKP
jgi:thioredoxin-like negative regulator of GroEL